jgi:hypothetical protein
MKQVATKVGLSVLTALTGGAAWMIAEPGAQSLMSAVFKPVAPVAEAAAAEVTGLKDSQVANVSLGAAMDGLLSIARAANRPDVDLVSLIAAKARISELNAKISGLGAGDEAALELLNNDINETALSAARSEIAALSVQADKIGGSIRSDFLAAEKELAASKKTLDADSAQARASFEGSMSAIKSAVVISVGSDAPSVVAAASNAEQAMVALTSLKSTGQSAFSKTKRESFNASLKAARPVGEEIIALAAGKKANVFSSRERKADAKYVQDTAAWAKARIAELDQASAKIATADRKTLVQSASRAAEINAELQAAVVHVREISARLTAPKS